MENIKGSEVNFKQYTMLHSEQTLYDMLRQATPQNAKSPVEMELAETLPASESQLTRNLHGSPEQESVQAPLSPSSSLPSSASKAQDEVL